MSKLTPPPPFAMPFDEVYTQAKVEACEIFNWELLVNGKPVSVGDTLHVGDIISYREKQKPTLLAGAIGLTGSIGSVPVGPGGYWPSVTAAISYHGAETGTTRPLAKRDGQGSLLCQSCGEPFPYAEPDTHGQFKCHGCKMSM